QHLVRHHALFTFGENIGTKRFPVPTHGLKWLPTRQPVVTDFWRTRRSPPRAAVLTSVANWSTSDLKDITWRGKKYLWSKSREFLRFIGAATKAGEKFDLGTDIGHAAARTERERDSGRRRTGGKSREG